MTPIELIKSLNFSIKKGDIIVYNGNLVECVSEPRFVYRIKYTDGDFDVYYTSDFSEVRGNDWEISGYVFAKANGEKIYSNFYEPIDYSRYEPNVDAKLDMKYQKLMRRLKKGQSKDKN